MGSRERLVALYTGPYWSYGPHGTLLTSNAKSCEVQSAAPQVQSVDPTPQADQDFDSAFSGCQEIFLDSLETLDLSEELGFEVPDLSDDDQAAIGIGTTHTVYPDGC